MCNLVILGFIAQFGGAFAGSANDAYDNDGEWDSWDVISVVAYNICNVIGIFLFIYSTVLFGRAASAIARKENLEYEPAECCEEKCFSCCPGCCTSTDCFLTYFCCLSLHMIQVARSMETVEELTTNVLNSRPADCRCCNCWVAKLDFAQGAAYGALDPS